MCLYIESIVLNVEKSFNKIYERLKMKKARIFTILLFILTGLTAIAQEQTIETITGGKEYWFALPLAGREQNESIRGDFPVAIWISSKVNTRVKIEQQYTSVDVKKDTIAQVPMGDLLMMEESEVVKNKGIQLIADDPISVSVFISYKWTGEAFRVIPTEMLGKEYVTMNLYQDQLKQDGWYRPPQILIVATQDKTTVNYTPTTETTLDVPTISIRPLSFAFGTTTTLFSSFVKVELE